jgi:hypothetical protein
MSRKSMEIIEQLPLVRVQAAHAIQSGADASSLDVNQTLD